MNALVILNWISSFRLIFHAVWQSFIISQTLDSAVQFTDYIQTKKRISMLAQGTDFDRDSAMNQINRILFVFFF